MNLPRLQIRNIKVSLILEDDCPDRGIFRHDNAVITIYPANKKLINVTKIKTLDELYSIESDIEKMYKVKIKQTRIDAIMLSRKVKNKRFSEQKYLKTLKKYQHIYKMDYNHESFHSPWFKSNDGRGSFNLFSTGSCTAMGIKSVNDIMLIEKILNEAFCETNEIKKVT